MSYKPKRTEAKLLKILRAWRMIAPEKTFGGITIEQFEAKVSKGQNARRRLKSIKIEEAAIITERENADAEAMNAASYIVAGVLGEPTEGANSALYELMGYVRKSKRKTGLTRKRKSAVKKEK